MLSLCVLVAMIVRLGCQPALTVAAIDLENTSSACMLSDSHVARNVYAILLLLMFVKILAYTEIYEARSHILLECPPTPTAW